VRIGYPCLNRGIGCSAAKTFRLASYSEARLIDSVGKNLECLEKILEYNVREGLLFFRISSDTVPFASHRICDVDWVGKFASRFQSIGDYIRQNTMRISMHPDQFTLINSPRPEVNEQSRAELLAHALLLDAMGMGPDAKIQIHVGGMYGDKTASIERFISTAVRSSLPAIACAASSICCATASSCPSSGTSSSTARAYRSLTARSRIMPQSPASRSAR